MPAVIDDRHPGAFDVTAQSSSVADTWSPEELETGKYGDGLLAFMSVRARLFAIAYRMMRSAADAEDIVQDVWVRWQTADRSVVRNASAFLAATTTRLAINVIRSAHSRRETYTGTWIPEPMDEQADPWLGVERREALRRGVLLLAKKLSPTEQAAYILREGFDLAYRDIALTLGLGEANARQLVTRARKRVADVRRSPDGWEERPSPLEAAT